MTDLVFISNNQTKTTSLKVAEYFKKDHSKVMRAIKSLIDSNDIAAANFGLCDYEAENEQGISRKYPMYEMNRDGFTLLTMGFTGKKALNFKVAYIQAFNAMEARLRVEAQPQALTQTQALLESVKMLVALEEKVNSIADSQARLIERVEKVETEGSKPIQITIGKMKDYKAMRKERMLEEYRRPIADLVLTLFSHVPGYAERWRLARSMYRSTTGENFPHVDKANEAQLKDFLNWLNTYKY